jgi:hypothetical protein
MVSAKSRRNRCYEIQPSTACCVGYPNLVAVVNLLLLEKVKKHQVLPWLSSCPWSFAPLFMIEIVECFQISGIAAQVGNVLISYHGNGGVRR